MVGDRVIDRIHPEDLPDVLDALARLRNTDATEVSDHVSGLRQRRPHHRPRAELRGYDTTDVPGVEGILVVVGVRGLPAGPPGDGLRDADFSLADASPLGLAVVSRDR